MLWNDALRVRQKLSPPSADYFAALNRTEVCNRTHTHTLISHTWRWLRAATRYRSIVERVYFSRVRISTIAPAIIKWRSSSSSSMSAAAASSYHLTSNPQQYTIYSTTPNPLRRFSLSTNQVYTARSFCTHCSAVDKPHFFSFENWFYTAMRTVYRWCSVQCLPHLNRRFGTVYIHTRLGNNWFTEQNINTMAERTLICGFAYFCFLFYFFV